MKIEQINLQSNEHRAEELKVLSKDENVFVMYFLSTIDWLGHHKNESILHPMLRPLAVVLKIKLSNEAALNSFIESISSGSIALIRVS